MGDSRGNTTQSVQNMAGPKKTGRNDQRFKKQQPGQDEQNVAQIGRLGRPGNIEAEKNVLGSILLKPDVCDDVALSVRSEDFSDEAHQTIFRHLLDLHDGGKRIDATILLERLRTKGDLDAVGGAAAIAELIGSVPHAAHASHYAHIIRDKSMLRSLIDASTDILRDAYDAYDEPRELLSQAEEKIFSILEQRSSAERSLSRLFLKT